MKKYAALLLVLGLIAIPSVGSSAYTYYSFTDNEDGTITDNRTDLMWQKGFSELAWNWEYAHTYCEELELAGYNDWSLPDIDQLNSMMGVSFRYTGANPKYFDYPDDVGWFWSSTTDEEVAALAYAVYITNGYEDSNVKIFLSRVRCVR